MLTSLEVYSDQSSPPDLPLELGGQGNTDPIHVRNIEGLGPVKANINTRALAADGEFFTGANLPKRNIVLTLGLNPDWADQTMSSLRHMLYGFFMTKANVRLRFFSDDIPTVEIGGYVESFEPNIFTKDPEVQISVICPMPDFIAVDPVVLEGYATATALVNDFSYRGNLPAGVIFEMKNTTLPDGPTYDGLITLESQTLAPGAKTFAVTAQIDAISSLKVTSDRGNRAALNVFGPESSSVLNSLVAGSVWPVVYPGINKFRALIESPTGKPWTLSYFERFGGL